MPKNYQVTVTSTREPRKETFKKKNDEGKWEVIEFYEQPIVVDFLDGTNEGGTFTFGLGKEPLEVGFEGELEGKLDKKNNWRFRRPYDGPRGDSGSGGGGGGPKSGGKVKNEPVMSVEDCTTFVADRFTEFKSFKDEDGETMSDEAAMAAACNVCRWHLCGWLSQ